MNCAGCNALFVIGAGLLRCSVCEESYHFECLNIQPRQYEGLTEGFKAVWKCPSCNNVTQRSRSNLLTPVRSAQIPEPEDSLNMSCDVMEPCPTSSYNPSVGDEPVGQDTTNTFQAFSNELHNTLQGWRSEINNTLSSFKDEIKTTLSSLRVEIDTSISKLNNELRCNLDKIRDEMNSIRIEHNSLKQNVSDISQHVTELKTSLQFHSEEQVQLKERMADMSRQCAEQSIQSISILESKLDYLEQQARQCNVEIVNVPETRSENLIHLMESISSSINFPVIQKDIISIHRVPHAHQTTNRPKNIIVKLSSRILRDNVLAAFRKVKTFKSDQLGFVGSPTTIYMNEHLTLKKKHLFRKVKEVATQHHFQYVWIRNATILVRERDGETAFAIHKDEDIRKIKNSQSTNNSGSGPSSNAP